MIEDIQNLKALLLFYHGEPIRKIQIDELIDKIENEVKTLTDGKT